MNVGIKLTFINYLKLDDNDQALTKWDILKVKKYNWTLKKKDDIKIIEHTTQETRKRDGIGRNLSDGKDFPLIESETEFKLDILVNACSIQQLKVSETRQHQSIGKTLKVKQKINT